MCDLLTVGEPINHEAWEWFHNVVGDGQCPLVDTWWQTGKTNTPRDSSCPSIVPLVLSLAALMGWFTPCVMLFRNKWMIHWALSLQKPAGCVLPHSQLNQEQRSGLQWLWDPFLAYSRHYSGRRWIKFFNNTSLQKHIHLKVKKCKMSKTKRQLSDMNWHCEIQW